MTAIAGRRMAETVARRGGLAVIPQDIPIDVVTDVVSWVKSRHLVHDTPITLAPRRDRRRRAGAAAQAGPRRRRRRRRVGTRPVGVVTEADLTGVDRFTQVARGHVAATCCSSDDGIDPRRPSTGCDARHRQLAPVVDDDGRLVGILTRTGALRATPLHARTSTTTGRLRIAAAVGINGDVAGQGQAALLDAGRRPARHRHRARPPGEDDRARCKAVRALDPQVPVVAGNVVCGRGRPRPRRGRRRHRQGRGRPGRHVHDPDDDRRRPPAVLGGAGVRRRGAQATASTSGPTAACGTRATSPWPWPPARPTS